MNKFLAICSMACPSFFALVSFCRVRADARAIHTREIVEFTVAMSNVENLQQKYRVLGVIMEDNKKLRQRGSFHVVDTLMICQSTIEHTV